MSSTERLIIKSPQGLGYMAKPGIPVENPQRREIPEIVYPTVPTEIPASPEPARVPREPVPVG